MSANLRRVFISHIHEEAAIAGVLREWINDAFRGSGVTAFQSSDREDLPAGRKSLDVVQDNLRDSKVLIGVLSFAAIRRPWPNIELGAAWSHGITIIPYCHSGLRADELDRPFGDFQGVNDTDDEPGKGLLHGVADAMQLKFSEKLHFAQFDEELRAAASRSKASTAAPTAPAARASLPRLTIEGVRLPDVQVEILKVLAAAMNAGSEYLPARRAAESAHLQMASFQGHIHELENERGFVHVSYGVGQPSDVKITDYGCRWLEANWQMPK